MVLLIVGYVTGASVNTAEENEAERDEKWLPLIAPLPAPIGVPLPLAPALPLPAPIPLAAPLPLIHAPIPIIL